MKQHITVKQLDELSKRGKKKVWKWCEDRDYLVESVIFHREHKKVHEKSEVILPLLSIGQMIEFLAGKYKDLHFQKAEFGRWDILNCYSDVKHKWSLPLQSSSKLCDALWEACQEALEK